MSLDEVLIVAAECAENSVSSLTMTASPMAAAAETNPRISYSARINATAGDGRG